MDKKEIEYECSDCGSSVQGDATVCPECGVSLEESEEITEKEAVEYECSDCGSLVQADATVCPKCAASMEELVDSKQQASSDFRDRWDTKQHVEDESAPLLYSKKAIYSFSVFFSVLFGAVLMMLNVRTLKKPEAVVPIVSFSLAYMVTVYFVLDFLESQTHKPITSGYSVGVIGGVLMQKILWGQFIGKEIKYRPRSIMVPTIIGILLMALLFVAIYVGSDHSS